MFLVIILSLLIFIIIAIESFKIFLKFKIKPGSGTVKNNNKIDVTKFINGSESSKLIIPLDRCYLSNDNSNKSILHLIFTRFLMEFWNINYFGKIIYKKEYILNGIRVMKKYLLDSL